MQSMRNQHGDAAEAPEPTQVHNFKQIKGIGPSMERCLHDAGILTFAQLAALTPADIAVLVADIASISAERIARQDWIGQARELSAQSGAVNAQPDDIVEEPRRHYATFTVQLLLDEAGDVRRTHVRYVQGDHEDVWAGWEAEKLIAFFVEQAALRIPMPTPAQAPDMHGKENGERHETTVEERMKEQAPDTLPVEETAEAQAHVETPTERARADKRVDVEKIALERVAPLRPAHPPRVRAHITFRIAGDSIPDEDETLPCAVQLLACELESGQTTLLAAEQQQLRPGVAAYTTAVEFDPPPAGHYQLMGIVLLAAGAIAGVGLGPILRAVASPALQMR
jgi:hypothetical protein